MGDRSPSWAVPRARCTLLALAACVGLAATSTTASAASLFGIVEQGGSTISDPAGIASIAPGTTATVSIYLSLGDGEDATLFEGVFDLSVVGVGATADPVAVESAVGGWSSVAQNTLGGQSTWSDISDPLNGDRLVAQWSIDASLAANGDSFGVLLGAGTFAGKDLPVSPFFELIPIANDEGALLARVDVGVIPEPGTASLLALGLVGMTARIRSRRMRHIQA